MSDLRAALELARDYIIDVATDSDGMDPAATDILIAIDAALASAPDEGPTFWNQAEQRIEHARPAAPAALDVDALPEATYQETAYGSTVSRDAIRAALAASAPEEEPRYHIRATDSMHHEHRRLAASAPDEGPPCIKCGYPEYPSHHDPKMPQWEDHPFEADLRYPPRLAASAPDEGPRYSVEIVSRFPAVPAALDVERLLSAAHNHSWSNDCNLDGHNAGGGPAAGDECAECEHILDEYAARYGARPAAPAALDVDKTSLDAAWETGYHEGVRRSRLTSVTEWLGPCCTHPEPGCVTCGFVPDAALRAEEPTR